MENITGIIEIALAVFIFCSAIMFNKIQSDSLGKLMHTSMQEVYSDRFIKDMTKYKSNSIFMEEENWKVLMER